MNRNEFDTLEFIDKINYLNSRLCNGDTVIRIREDIGIGEKSLQREIRENGYKYSSKDRQYIPNIESTTQTTTSSDTSAPTEYMPIVVEPTTSVIPKQQIEILDYLENNFDVLKNFLDKYKTTTESTTQSTTNKIVINLVDDKHLNPKPKSIRINEFIYKDWQQFCESNYYSKQDLISMALKEYMEKYK